MRLRKILLPTDFEEPGEAPRSLAVSLSKSHGAELLLYSAVVTHENELRRVGGLLQDFVDRLAMERSAKLEAEAGRLEADHGIVARSLVEKRASAFEAIRDRAEEMEPDLIVMGTHGRSGVERWFLGSVAEKVVRHVPRPVLTVRPETKTGPLRRVLVPVDFSDNSRRAVEVGAGLAGEEGTLVLLHVVPNPAFAGLHPGEYLRLFEADRGLPSRIRDHMNEWMEGRAFEAEVREAEDVGRSIIEVAEEKAVDLVSIGSRGLTGLDYFLMGSVAEKVVRGSLVPVLTVK